MLIAVSIYWYFHLLWVQFPNIKLYENIYQKFKEKTSNKVKDIDIKNHAYYFFNDIINIKNFDPNNFKVDGKSNKNIFIYYIGYVMIKGSKYVKIMSLYPLYLIFNKVNVYFAEINGNN